LGKLVPLPVFLRLEHHEIEIGEREQRGDGAPDRPLPTEPSIALRDRFAPGKPPRHACLRNLDWDQDRDPN